MAWRRSIDLFRITAVADVFDALSSDRSTALPEVEAICGSEAASLTGCISHRESETRRNLVIEDKPDLHRIPSWPVRIRLLHAAG